MGHILLGGIRAHQELPNMQSKGEMEAIICP